MTEIVVVEVIGIATVRDLLETEMAIDVPGVTEIVVVRMIVTVEAGMTEIAVVEVIGIVKEEIAGIEEMTRTVVDAANVAVETIDVTAEAVVTIVIAVIVDNHGDHAGSVRVFKNMVSLFIVE